MPVLDSVPLFQSQRRSDKICHRQVFLFSINRLTEGVDSELPDQEQNGGPGSFHQEGDVFVFDKPISQEEVTRNSREDEQRESARQQLKTNKKLAWFTGFLVLGTFVGSGISIWQAKIAQIAATAAKDEVKTAKDQMRLENRAWVGITFPNLDPAKEINKSLPLQVVFQCPIEVSNYGRTPARIVEIKGNCSIIRSGSDPIDLGASGPRHHSLIRFESIQPNETEKDWAIAAIIEKNGKAVPMLTTEEIWEKVRTAKLTVIAHGYITYTDSFGKNHWIRFCHAYNGYCPEICFQYNDSDQEIQ